MFYCFRFASWSRRLQYMRETPAQGKHRWSPLLARHPFKDTEVISMHLFKAFNLIFSFIKYYPSSRSPCSFNSYIFSKWSSCWPDIYSAQTEVHLYEGKYIKWCKKRILLAHMILCHTLQHSGLETHFNTFKYISVNTIFNRNVCCQIAYT